MRIGFNRPTALIASAAMGAVFCLAAIRTTGQATRAGQATRPIRTPDGHPNLNGIWQATTTANWDLLAHAMRPAVAQPGVYPDVPVLAAPVLALGGSGSGVFLGYHNIAHFPWIDSLLNASMILGGMGPVGNLESDAAKVFASVYALFSGIVFIAVLGMLLAPFVHRIMHKLHMDEAGK